MSEDQTKKNLKGSSGLSGEELDQVRDLLFGGTIRELEREREALQNDVHVSFAEADQMTNRRLDDVMRRLDALHQEMTRDREERKTRDSNESSRFDKTLVKLASEQSTALAQETQRIDQAIAVETQRMDGTITSETKRIDQAIATEIKRMDDAIAAETKRMDNAIAEKTQQMDERLAAETKRMNDALAAETKRIDEALKKETLRIDQALDVLHRQIETDKLQHIDALRRSVSVERTRLSQSLRLLAEGVDEDTGDDNKSS